VELRSPVVSARSTIIETLPEETSLFGGTAEVRFTHIPASHAKALHPDSQLVVGMRGAGKSFWWAALQSTEHRALVAALAPRAGLTEEANIAIGFGERPNPDAYPGRDVLAKLVRQGHDPRLIWRTIILRALSRPDDNVVGGGGAWVDRVNYVAANPEVAESFLDTQDRAFEARGTYWIILFDALDRCASDWPTMNALIRGLLEAVLDLRSYRRLRAKCFLRTDQLNEREVATFPDASKVLTAKVDLTWPPLELYNLLFRYLGNADDPNFRAEVASLLKHEWEELRVSGHVAWLPPENLRRSEQKQREVFHSIAGPWMGRDWRRGYPYTWVPNHLADAEGRTSPRSFLAALRKAARDTEDRYPGHDWPLHFDSIKRGVQEASAIRVKELQEDYPWVHSLMEPLRGMVVPCLFEDVASAWESQNAVERLRERVKEGQERLPPASLEVGAGGLRKDLEELGIFLRLKDGRVNIPDVFRVGYGLGRRGGVKPILRGESR